MSASRHRRAFIGDEHPQLGAPDFAGIRCQRNSCRRAQGRTGSDIEDRHVFWALDLATVEQSVNQVLVLMGTNGPGHEEALVRVVHRESEAFDANLSRHLEVEVRDVPDPMPCLHAATW